jgi:hypothetical protein
VTKEEFVLKFLKNFIIATGIVLIGAAVAFMVVSYMTINSISATLVTTPQTEFQWKPLYWFYLGGAAVSSLVGAFLLGLGIGIPRQTLKQKLKKTTETQAPAPVAAPPVMTPPSAPPPSAPGPGTSADVHS